MAGDTDLDLALAVALAEGLDGFSDDDFKSSGTHLGRRQERLFLECKVKRKKQMKASRIKRQKVPGSHAGNGVKTGNSRKGNVVAPVAAQCDSDAIAGLAYGGFTENCAGSSVLTAEGRNVFDQFRHQNPPKVIVPAPDNNVDCRAPDTKDRSEAAVASLPTITRSMPGAQLDSAGRRETNQPDVDIGMSQEEGGCPTEAVFSVPEDSDTEEVIRLDEESELSVLLSLCTEEGMSVKQDSSSVGLGEGSSSKPEHEEGSVVVDTGFEAINEVHDFEPFEYIDDVSHLMTQQRAPVINEASERESRAALQDITNQATFKYTVGDCQEQVSKVELETAIVRCPICEVDLSTVNLESRVKHTEMCLNKGDKQQDGLKEHKPEEVQPLTRDFSISFGCEKVKRWLENLNLSRYMDSFNQHEIDWDTLQWLTDEDLQVIGVTCLGPRRKILGAIQDLKPACKFTAGAPSAVGEAVTTNGQSGCKDGSNVITNFFPITTSAVKRTSSVASGNASLDKHGINVRRSKNHPPRVVHRPNIEGIPPWMCIPGTPFRVDAFQHLSGNCSHWFLTHFHTDHYQGLTRGFRYGRIFCSAITARLVNLRIGVSWDRLMIVPLNEKHNISGVNVTFIDANHCPGSVMILFEPPNREAVLHTGDFRFCTAMAANTVLQSTQIQTLILDTTYCDPQYDFPRQDAVVQFVIDAIQAEAFNRDTLFLIGTYTIGKERLFLEVGKVLQKKVYVGAAKMKLLECMDLTAEDTQWLTANDHESFIHVVPLWSISSFKRMTSISRHYRDGVLVGGRKKTPGKRHQQGTMIRYEVPYSEHSSFNELKEFVKFIGPRDIVPSVIQKQGTGVDNMIASLWSEVAG